MRPAVSEDNGRAGVLPPLGFELLLHLDEPCPKGGKIRESLDLHAVIGPHERHDEFGAVGIVASFELQRFLAPSPQPHHNAVIDADPDVRQL